MNSFFEMGCQVDSPFLRCLSMEAFKILGRNMVCSHYCNFMVDMDNTMVDRIVAGSLDRMGTLVESKGNSCCKCTDFLH